MSHRPRRNRVQHIPYEDAVAFDRRWGHLDPQNPSRDWRSDPLRFVADHVSVRDRREGSIAAFVDFGPGVAPLMTIAPDAPANPTDDDFVRFLARLVVEIEDRQAGHAPVTLRMGLVHHRRGPASVTELDRRWLTAVQAAARACDFEVVGVMARTESGALVPITQHFLDCSASTPSGR